MRTFFVVMAGLCMGACGDSAGVDAGAMDAGRDAAMTDGGGTDAPMVDAPTSDAPMTDAPMGDACTPTRTPVTALPVDVYVMLSQAGSMGDVAGGGTKWDGVTTGLATFAATPGVTSMSMGIQYFGLTSGVVCPTSCAIDADCGSCGPCFAPSPGTGICMGAGGDSCVASDYATPEVELMTLPAGATALSASMASHAPSTATAMSAAVQGAVDHLATWSGAHAGHVVAALVITSGDPTECDTVAGNIDTIASTALASSAHTRTFVVSVTPGLSSPDGLAAAGGTGAALELDPSGAPLAGQVVDAMTEVRDIVGCTYAAPAGSGLTVERASTPVVQVANLAACGAIAAWYFDEGGHVALCPITCGAVLTAGGEITISSGC